MNFFCVLGDFTSFWGPDRYKKFEIFQNIKISKKSGFENFASIWMQIVANVSPELKFFT